MINTILPGWLVRALQRVDAVLLAALSLLIFLGLTTLYSASGADETQVIRQAVHFLIGLFLIVVFSQIQSNLTAVGDLDLRCGCYPVDLSVGDWCYQKRCNSLVKYRHGHSAF